MTDPSIEGGNGNCPQGYNHNDLNGDGYEQSGECWRGMIIKDGRVGIGTTDPIWNVRVEGEAGEWTNLALTRPGDDGFGLIQYYGATTSGMIIRAGGNGNPIRFCTDSMSGERKERLRITGDGNIGINTIYPNYMLHVNGSAAGNSWTNLSSREYKEHIKRIDDTKHSEMLAQLMEMDLTTYKYKEEFGGDKTTKLGFIAEEMPKEVLSKDGKGVDIYELLAFTIGAMKAQQEQIEKLEARLDLNQ